MSDYTLNLSVKALNDIRNAMLWYSDISSTLENQLIDELDFFYDKIKSNPFRYGFYPVTTSFRRVKLKQFPYYILYTLDSTTILIAGIVHTARSPKFVRRRYR